MLTGRTKDCIAINMLPGIVEGLLRRRSHPVELGRQRRQQAKRAGRRVELFDEKFDDGTITEFDSKVFSGLNNHVRLALRELGLKAKSQPTLEQGLQRAVASITRELATAESNIRWRKRPGLRAIERLPVMTGPLS